MRDLFVFFKKNSNPFPYRKASFLGVREKGSSGYRDKKAGWDNRNSKSVEAGDGIKGEDNLWTWENIKKTEIKYAQIFENK